MTIVMTALTVPNGANQRIAIEETIIAFHPHRAPVSRPVVAPRRTTPHRTKTHGDAHAHRVHPDRGKEVLPRPDLAVHADVVADKQAAQSVEQHPSAGGDSE